MVTENRIRLTGLLRRSPRLARASLLVGVFAFVPPAPQAPIPRDPAALAQALSATSTELRAAITRWTPKTAAPPRDVVLYALYQQRTYRLLGRDENLARRTLPLLAPGLRGISRNLLRAHHELYRLTPPLPSVAIKVGPAAPATALLADYREAERRFRVPWDVLAAVNFVESKFGKLRSASAAGAQGPMQFMPATWRRYGLGGDVLETESRVHAFAFLAGREDRRRTCLGQHRRTRQRGSVAAPPGRRDRRDAEDTDRALSAIAHCGGHRLSIDPADEHLHGLIREHRRRVIGPRLDAFVIAAEAADTHRLELVHLLGCRDGDDVEFRRRRVEERSGCAVKPRLLPPDAEPTRR